MERVIVNSSLWIFLCVNYPLGQTRLFIVMYALLFPIHEIEKAGIQMNTPKLPACVVRILVVSLFCFLPLCAFAEDAMDLDSTQVYKYEYYISEADLSLYMPQGIEVKIVHDQPGQKGYLLIDPDYTDAVFVFFAIREEYFKGMSLTDMNEPMIRDVISVISPDNTSMPYTIIDNFLPGMSVLKVAEQESSVYVVHLVTIRDGWILNLMAQCDGPSITEETESIQNGLMASILNDNINDNRLQEFTISKDIAVTVPESLYIKSMLDIPEEKMIAFSPKKSGKQFSPIIMHAVWNQDYGDDEILSLEDADLQKLIRELTFLDHESSTAIPLTDLSSNTDILLLYDNNSPNTKYLFALKDGWAICLTTFFDRADEVGLDWLSNANVSIMMQLLGEDISVPEWMPAAPIKQEGSTIQFPLMKNIYGINIPNDYYAVIPQDSSDYKEVYFYPSDNSAMSINLYARYIGGNSSDLTQTYSQDEIEELGEALVYQGQQDTGLNLACTFVEQGPVEGVSAIHITSEDNTYEGYYWEMESYQLLFIIRSNEGPLSGEESSYIKDITVLSL